MCDSAIVRAWCQTANGAGCCAEGAPETRQGTWEQACRRRSGAPWVNVPRENDFVRHEVLGSRQAPSITAELAPASNQGPRQPSQHRNTRAPTTRPTHFRALAQLALHALLGGLVCAVTRHRGCQKAAARRLRSNALSCEGHARSRRGQGSELSSARRRNRGSTSSGMGIVRCQLKPSPTQCRRDRGESRDLASHQISSPLARFRVKIHNICVDASTETESPLAHRSATPACARNGHAKRERSCWGPLLLHKLSRRPYGLDGSATRRWTWLSRSDG